MDTQENKYIAEDVHVTQRHIASIYVGGTNSDVHSRPILQTKVFSDFADYDDTADAETRCNNWIKENSIDVVTITATTSTIEYVYVPEDTRGKHDHEHRYGYCITITVVYRLSN